MAEAQFVDNVDALSITSEQIVDGRGIYLRKEVNNSLYMIGKFGNDTICLSKYDIEKKTNWIMNFKINVEGELGNARDFTIIKDSLLAILCYNRDKVIVFSIGETLTKRFEFEVSNDSIPYLNWIESYGDNLYVIYRAQEYAEISRNKITFAVLRIILGQNIDIQTIKTLNDESCLLYNINSFNKTWAINSKYLFYSNGCTGKVQVYDLGNGTLKSELTVFKNNQTNNTLSEVKKYGYRYRIHPSTKLLFEVDNYYFLKPNIFLIDCTDDKLLIVSSDSCFTKQKSFDLQRDLKEFAKNVDYRVYKIEEQGFNLVWGMSNLVSRSAALNLKEVFWNYSNLSLMDKGFLCVRNIYKDVHSFSNNVLDFKLSYFTLKLN